MVYCTKLQLCSALLVYVLCLGRQVRHLACVCVSTQSVRWYHERRSEEVDTNLL